MAYSKPSEDSQVVGGLALSEPASEVQEPPAKLGGILRQLGPGLIMAAGIVGSGELIAATLTGAKAGFIFLGLIFFGCFIKCFTQVEIARHAIVRGETTLRLLNRLPGPRLALGKFSGNWIVLFWAFTMIFGFGQLGGIVGGVGQGMAIAMPITEKGREYNEAASARAKLTVLKKKMATAPNASNLKLEHDKLSAAIVGFDFQIKPKDDRIWALILAGLTSVMLVRGGFGFIETFAAVLVGAFTLVTIANLFVLQTQPEWAVRAADFREGLGFGFLSSGSEKIGVALATFGIIGVGAAEIVAYPYWCLEKGYGRWTGARDDSEGWFARARGWIRVMQWDAWLSMVIYTFCTVVFYLLGAAVLSQLGLVPEKQDLIRTLSVMFSPVFGGYAVGVFLFGAVAVLFSTFFISNATKCRLYTDFASVSGLANLDETQRERWVRGLGAMLPMICVCVYVVWPNPGKLVLISGIFQSLLLVPLGFAVLWLRYREGESRLQSGRGWDVMLWVSFISFVTIGIYLAVTKLGKISS